MPKILVDDARLQKTTSYFYFILFHSTSTSLIKQNMVKHEKNLILNRFP